MNSACSMTRRRLGVGKALMVVCALLASSFAKADPPHIVYSFEGSFAGGSPVSRILDGPSHYFLFGASAESAPDGRGISWGSIFKMNADGTNYQILHAFTGREDGGAPGQMLRGTVGGIFGTTMRASQGGAQHGTVFRISYGNWIHRVLHTFNGADGSTPGAALTQDPEGSQIFGVTRAGGGAGQGVIFRMRTDGSNFTVIHEFSGDAEGGQPSGLTMGSDGRLYGVTAGGGAGAGVVFALLPSGRNFRILHVFDETKREGSRPLASLVEHPDTGDFYGTTSLGGRYQAGTVFRVTRKGEFSTLYSFDPLEGAYPSGSLAVGTDGALYGATPSGGPSGADRGALFRLAVSGTRIDWLPLDATAYDVRAGMTAGPAGLLYLPAFTGGALGHGAVLSVAESAFPAAER